MSPQWVGQFPTGQIQTDISWQEWALCARTDPDAFFPERGGATQPAKRVCAKCEVRTECREYALANGEQHGVWGGLTPRELLRLRRARDAA